MKKELELLAPAKNRDIGIAAINCGADALYIAGPSFGAREAAGNPIEDIESLASYAHRYRAKVYMTLNTILFQNEMEEAVELAHQAWRAGCDALIIQDMGLLNMDLPPIPLFASTQTNIRDVAQAKLLESLGFSRLILARELSLQQIKEIRESVGVELESFIHGALCVSYSGQCYLSAKATGRSANRGVCAQACRSTYNLIDGNGDVLFREKALLSLKDLNLSGYIPNLVDAGISSFKIEGRLKNISYIKNIVRYYRGVIDSFISGREEYKASSSGKLWGGFTPRPELTFNRGYTNLFITGERGKWQSRESAKSIGEYIGKVENVIEQKAGNLMFGYKSDIKIGNGDGLCFITPKGKVLGARASITTQNTVTTNEPLTIPLGSQIYRNYNLAFEKELEQNMPKRLIEVGVEFFSINGKTIIKCESEDGICAQTEPGESADIARNEELARQSIASQLGKTSDIYKFNLRRLEADKLMFYPAATLNESRRTLAAELNIGRERKRQEQKSLIESDLRGKLLDSKLYSGIYLDYRANISNALSRELYRSLGVAGTEDAYEISAPAEAELMRCKYCIRFELGFCLKEKTARKIDEPLFLENNGKRYRLSFDCKNCEMVIFG